MPRPLSLVAAPAIALLGLAAVPAVGSASAIAPSAPCYSTYFQSGKGITYQPMTGTITGGTPGGRFQIYGVGGKASDFVGNFDAAGNAAYTISSYSSPGISPSAGRTVKLEVNEFLPSGTAVTGSASVKVSTIASDVSSKPRSPLRARVIRTSSPAFAGKKVYANVIRGTKGTRAIKRISLGTANSCGYVRTRAVAVPRNYRTGKHSIFFSTTKKVNKTQAPGYSFSITRRYY